jgi:hypothetical protein
MIRVHGGRGHSRVDVLSAKAEAGWTEKASAKPVRVLMRDGVRLNPPELVYPDGAEPVRRPRGKVR